MIIHSDQEQDANKIDSSIEIMQKINPKKLSNNISPESMQIIQNNKIDDN